MTRAVHLARPTHEQRNRIIELGATRVVTEPDHLVRMVEVRVPRARERERHRELGLGRTIGGASDAGPGASYSYESHQHLKFDNT